MSHGVHAVQHEVQHQIEHEEHGHGHGGGGKPLLDNTNKKIALLISVIALFLALAEMFGKSAQTEGISLNIKASDTWNFFQAKTIRQTSLRTAAQALTVEAATIPDEARKAALLKQADEWMKTVARYESDPQEKDGRKELRAPRNTSTTATRSWRATITTSSRRRPTRSASCWRRRRSSPA
jgi:Domain of unknown function (DUF4337)